jgi:hypothetical protein
MLNKYILTSIGIFLLCFMVSCSNDSTQDTAVLGTSTPSDYIDTENTQPYDITTTTVTTTPYDTTTQTSLEPSEYKSIMENTITSYETMLTQLNSLVQNFSQDDTWDTEIQSCLDTSQQYLDYMLSLQSSGAVPKKYSKSHERIVYCMNHYTESIKLIQSALQCYLVDDSTTGDDYMNQALNRSQLANKVWSEIRGYGIVEYTGETLPTQVVYSEPEQQIVSYEQETIVLQTPAETTTQETYQQYNDGYDFNGDNVFIYTN